MDKEKFDKLISENGLVLVDFYATWCMPCKMQSEILGELTEESVPGLKIEKINVDENEDFVREFNIVSIPTLLAYKDGRMIKRYVGIAKTEDIVSWYN